MQLRAAAGFLRANLWRVVFVSVLLLAPVFWHRHIEAGDLASHTYNAWLAQLIERGQAPGLYTVPRWNNVLVDLTLLRLGNLFGLRAAERILVSVCVLSFFWGAFALIAAAGVRPPWFLVPALAMIAFGYTFYMGFFNFYWSIGLGFFAIALLWRGSQADWIAAAVLAGIALLAHPMGFLCTVGAAAYLKLAQNLRGWLRWLLFAGALGVVLAIHFYVLRFRTVMWDTPTFYEMNGTDQFELFGDRYETLAWIVLGFGVFCFLYGTIREWKASETRWSFRGPLELWAVILFAAAMIPEVIWVPQYAGVIGLIISRLTSISAVLGLCVLASLRPRKWHLAGFTVLAAIFFTWTYQDTGVLNRMEDQAEALVSTVPYGRRLTETIIAPGDSRIWFINHMVDRACVGRCFTYENYEPASLQFRIRVQPGSPIVTASEEDSEAMESGEYEVQAEDLPMEHIYQCDEKDFTRLCIRALAVGEVNGRLGRHPTF